MMQKILLCAEDGKILTDGKIYGKIVYLGSQDSINNYYEITIEEYQQILAIQNPKEELEEEFIEYEEN